MRECICCQCAETPNDFKFHEQCLSCDMYGSQDEFSLDANKEICDDCTVEAIENDCAGAFSQ